jgi:hypothetical protein
MRSHQSHSSETSVPLQDCTQLTVTQSRNTATVAYYSTEEPASEAAAGSEQTNDKKPASSAPIVVRDGSPTSGKLGAKPVAAQKSGDCCPVGCCRHDHDCAGNGTTTTTITMTTTAKTTRTTTTTTGTATTTTTKTLAMTGPACQSANAALRSYRFTFCLKSASVVGLGVT